MIKNHPAISLNVSLVVIMTLTIAVFATPNVTYANKPAVISELLNSFSSTTKIIGSNRAEELIISKYGNGTSNMTINVYSPTKNQYYRIYTYISVGSWSHLVSTKETLSCSLLFESNTSTFGFLQFLGDVESLKMYTNISLASLRDFLPAASSSADQNAIASNFVLGAGCYLGQLFGKIFSISNSGNILTAATVPPNWAIQASTESFVYAISSNMLYRYSKTLNQYDQVFSFANFSQYFLFEYQGRILVSASTNISNSTTANLTTFRVNQTIYLLLDGSGSPNVLFQASLEGFSNITSIKVFAAPKLTKFAYEYTPIGSSSAVIVVKSINYFNSKVIDLTWRDYAGFLQTRAAATYAEICFDDNFLLIRNASAKKNNSFVAVEEGYQYVNNQIIYFNRRTLAMPQNTYWLRFMADSNSDSLLASINFFKNSTSYSVYRAIFYNYVATKKIIPTSTQTSFIKFSSPSNVYSYSIDQLCWSYNTVNSTNISLTVVCYDPSLPGNINSFTTTPFTATGLSVRAVSYPDETKCRIIMFRYSNDTYSYFLAEYMSANNTLAITYDLNSIFATVGSGQINTISANCDRFNVGSNPNYVFHKINTTFQSASSNGSFLANFTDQNLTYAIYGSTVWKYDTTLAQYISYFTLSTLYPVVKFRAYQNRLIFVASNSVYLHARTQVLAFTDQNGNLTQFFNSTFIPDTFVSVKISTNLTKLSLIGMVESLPSVQLYHLDFSKKQSKLIYLSLTNIVDFTYFSFNLFDQYFHVRKNTNDYLSGPDEKVFYFQNDVNPKLVLSAGFAKVSDPYSYKRSTIIVRNSSVYLANEFYYSAGIASYTQVNLTQLNVTQVRATNNLNSAINVFYSGGIFDICPPGCNQCRNKICTSCADRFVLNTQTGYCRLCPGGYASCDSKFIKISTVCIKGFFSSYNDDCLPCNSQCVACTNSTMCTQCYPGYFVNSTTKKCDSCPRNCLQCTSATSCTLCRRGFVATSNGTCRGCSLSCSSCLADNITQCTACAVGLELQGSQCVPCPVNCQVCNQGYCQTCAPGYTPNAGACSLNCKLPCATCALGQPSTCLSCFGSGILNGNTCVFDISCNATADCTECGHIYGLFLLEFNCIPCSSVAFIPNCIQCSQLNQQQCVICEDGYFVGSTGNCQKCQPPCSICNNNATCVSCVNSSYTLTLNQTYGKCIPCQSPCATCSGDPTYCLTCVNGYTKKNWKCQNNTFIRFSLILSGEGVNTSQVLASIDAIVASLLVCITEDLTNIEVITITSVVSGSVVISGSIAPTSGDTSAASSALSAGLSNGTLAGFTVTASSITLEENINGGSDSSSNLKTQSIIGLVIGVVAFVVIIVMLVLYRCKSKNKIGQDIEQFPQIQWKKSSFFDFAVIKQQPSREMIVLEDISPEKK